MSQPDRARRSGLALEAHLLRAVDTGGAPWTADQQAHFDRIADEIHRLDGSLKAESDDSESGELIA